MRQRVVVDTNVLVSAALRPASQPRRALALALERDELVVCQAALDELRRVLQHRKFDAYAPAHERLGLLDVLLEHAATLDVGAEHHAQVQGACRDADDELFLALALSAQAPVIVSGDADLLTLHSWRGITICTPAQYLEHQR